MNTKEKSFDVTSEASKLLITVCTAVTAFGVAVVNVKAGDATFMTPSTSWEKLLLLSSWSFLILSIGCGVWTQLGIAHVLSAGTTANPDTIWNPKIRTPLLWQIGTFLIGLVWMITYSFAKVTG
jgi:hypothetical protein